MSCHAISFTVHGSDAVLPHLHLASSRPDHPVLSFKPSGLPRIPACFFRIKAGRASNNGRVFASATATGTATPEEMGFYELLGIPETVSLPEIKQAYKQLARKYHPDVSPPGRVEEYTQRFIRVQEAYETLSDPSRRAMYDRDMAMGLHLAFSARRRYPNQSVEEMDNRSEWKNRWQSQLSELKRRSVNKDAHGNMSWAARMRRQREGLADEL